jgi:transcriptional regulator with XRE-family HTH domain
MRKKNSQFIKLLKDGLEEIEKQSKLAKLIGVSESRIPEWMKGDRLPSPDTLINLGKLALERRWSDPFFFWALAGIDTLTLRSMADRVQKRQYELMGDTVPIPRFRETLQGRQDAGPAIPLPREFVPNPDATICLELSGPSDVVDAPHGVFILDTSILGTANVWAYQERVVLVDVPQLPGHGNPAGLYVGRLRLQGSYDRRRPDWVWLGVLLLSLTGSLHDRLQLGSYEEAEVMRGIAWEDADERDRRLADMWRRVGPNFPLAEGVRILGRVIGRLTGHLGK